MNIIADLNMQTENRENYFSIKLNGTDLAIAYMALVNDCGATGLPPLQKCLEVLLPLTGLGVILAHMVH